MRPVKPILQIALDFVDLPRAIAVAEEAVTGGAGWLEAGTPLIKSEGLQSVRELHARFPDHVIVADMKTMDAGRTEGGTGFGPRDVTPEAMEQVIEREAPGISEAARNYGQDRTPYAMLSRGKAGLRGRTLIVNLPGSRKGVAESLNALFPGLRHAFAMIVGGGH